MFHLAALRGGHLVSHKPSALGQVFKSLSVIACHCHPHSLMGCCCSNDASGAELAHEPALGRVPRVTSMHSSKNVEHN